MDLIAAEIRKLWTVRTTWIVTAVGWGLVALGVAVILFLAPTFTGEFAFTGTDGELAALIGQIGGATVIVLVVALLAMTTEFRHGTIGRTLQLVPGRTRVLVAKVVAGVLYSLAFFATSLVVVAVLAWLGGRVHGVPLDVGEEVARGLWEGPAALALTAVLGVAVGALLRSQVLAITVTLVWVMVVESLVAALVPRVGRWLPFQTLNALFVTEDLAAGGPTPLDPIAPELALPVFFGYVLLAAIPAVLLLRYRDV
jgi:ABC-2 type transport system permease protein